MLPSDEVIRYHLEQIDDIIGITPSPDDYAPHGFVANWELIPLFEMTVETAVLDAHEDNREALITFIRNNCMRGIMLHLLSGFLSNNMLDINGRTLEEFIKYKH